MANTQRHTNSRNPLASDGWVLAEAAFALIAAGFLPAPGADNAFYVLIPYAGAVVSCVLAAMAHFGLTFKRQAPDDYDRKTSVARRSLAGAIFSLVAAIGELAHTVFVGTTSGFGYAGPATSTTGSILPFAFAYVLLCLAGGLRLMALNKRQA